MTQIFKIYADKNLRKSAFLIRVICVLKKLFSCNNPFYLTQFIQRFDWREIIDVGIFDFVADLFQNWVVELEKTELITFAVFGDFAHRF